MWKVVNTETGEAIMDHGARASWPMEWERKSLADQEAHIQTERTGQFHEAVPVDHPPAQYEGRRKL